MRNFKLPLFLMAITIVSVALFAFDKAETKQRPAFRIKEAKTLTFQWFKLKTGQSPTLIGSYEPAGSDPGCASEHTNTVCRIYAESEDDMPTQESLDDVITASDNFSEAALGVVEYRQP